jgi:serine/threonine protein kinase
MQKKLEKIKEIDCDRFKDQEKIGEGTYGTVFKAFDTKTNRVVALKRIKLDDAENGFPSTTLREISILKECSHKNVVRFERKI